MNNTRWTVPASSRGATLLDFVADSVHVSRRKAKALLDARVVFVNNHRVWMARQCLRLGDIVEIHQESSESHLCRPQLLYQDDELVVADKPAGLLATGRNSLEILLRKQLKQPGLLAVHRLDKETTGCLILATNADVKAQMVKIFQAEKLTKVYRAIVQGKLPSGEGTLNGTIDGKRARTKYRVLDPGELASHVRIHIETGRKHQIRKHVAEAGHPIVGDRFYATKKIPRYELRAVPRQMLHAESIRFPHPETDEIVQATSPLPPDFTTCLRRFHLH